MKYNGWSNYATWCTALWLSNDMETYRAAQKAARDGRLKEFVEGMVIGELAFPDRASLASDLLTAALDDVDWKRIKEYLIEE